MIVGIGTDMIEVDRISVRFTRQPELLNTIFTDREIEYCQSMKYPFQHFAARFAAKEAYFKALGTGWRFGMMYKEIEVVKNELGQPSFSLSGKVKSHTEAKKINNCQLSLSHLREIASAFVILESSLNE